jgi:quercetin dioxygenase-like cupin family protein
MEQAVIEDPALKQRFRFSRSIDEDGAEVLHVEAWVDPGGGVPPHTHPSIEERFNVLSGQASFLAGRKWQTAGPGETVVVPAGVRHAYRNRGHGQVHFVCDVRPPSSLQAFLEDAAAMGRAGKLATRWAIPKGLRGLLQGAVLAESYRDMVVLGFPPLPPPPIQRLLFPFLARIGEGRGYRAGHFSENAPA